MLKLRKNIFQRHAWINKPATMVIVAVYLWRTVSGVLICTSWQVALGAERHPLPTCAFSSPKLNHLIYASLFRVLIFKSLQILACLFVVAPLTVKLRLKAVLLQRQCLILHLCFRQTI